MRKLIEESGNKGKYRDDIIGHLDFIKQVEPNLERCSVYLRYNAKSLLPFERTPNSSPSWWKAYNDVKHHDVSRHKQGNLENALNSVASLAILGKLLCGRINILLFANLGIVYPEGDPSISYENRLFPT